MHESSFCQEIIEEGQRLGARKSVLLVLTIRFGAAAAKEHEEALNRIEDLEQFSELLKVAIKSRRVSQFRRTLAALDGARTDPR
jgi:hypothetical protein